jgi:hypothetical protein
LIRVISIWLLVFGVCAGLQARALGVDPCEILAALHLHEHGHHDHDDDHLPPAPCESSHDEQCPLGHHHHDNCTHCMPLTVDLPNTAKVTAIGFSLVPILSDAARAPDAPYADLVKPPLI